VIERDAIIDAIADLQFSIESGDDFDVALAAISLDYNIPAKTIIFNIERVKPLDQFKNDGRQEFARSEEREKVFEPLREHLKKFYGAASEPPIGFFGTSVFIQKKFEREIWPQAHAYARRQIKTMRLTKSLHGNQNAAN
jgi:hypothetical protein